MLATKSAADTNHESLQHKSWQSASWFVSRTFMICVCDFPRGEVSVKVGVPVMEFGLFFSLMLAITKIQSTANELMMYAWTIWKWLPYSTHLCVSLTAFQYSLKHSIFSLHFCRLLMTYPRCSISVYLAQSPLIVTSQFNSAWPFLHGQIN